MASSDEVRRAIRAGISLDERELRALSSSAHRAAAPGRGDPRKRTLSGAIVDRRTGEPWRNFPAAEPESDAINYARFALCVAAIFAWCALGEALLP